MPKPTANTKAATKKKQRRPNLGIRAIDILQRAEPQQTLIVATRDMMSMRELAGLLGAFEPDIGLACLPEWDCLPGDHVSPSLGVMGERAGTLRWLASEMGKPRIVVTTVAALCQRVPPPTTWASAYIEIRPGQPLDPDETAARLERSATFGQIAWTMPGSLRCMARR